MTDDTRKTPVEAITHGQTRVNIPPAELEPVMEPDDKRPIRVAYERRNPDLDPQLVWRGKDMDLPAITADAPPIYLQEQVHPKAIIEDLRAGNKRNGEGAGVDLFDHFGLAEEDLEAQVEFYRHAQKWSNRMILGDGLQVMASLAEREGYKGKVQAIYIDPPYGIKFNSNFQWSTTSRDVTDGRIEHLTREPEQVKAFRDTWQDGIHSYLNYLRDRLVVARELLTESGSCFVQIGDENVHRVRALMDEVFGEENFISLITVSKTTSATADYLGGVADFVLWFGKDRIHTKYRNLVRKKQAGGEGGQHYRNVISDDGLKRAATEGERTGNVRQGDHLFTADQLQSTGSHGSLKSEGAASWFDVGIEGRNFRPTRQSIWKTSLIGMERLKRSNRISPQKTAIRYVRKFDDYTAYALNNVWTDIGAASEKSYVVETSPRLVERCLLMTTDPGNLVLDPTCGSGTTAYVAEQWGRRWITIDTSRVALALARARIMGAKYPWYLLADSPEGQRKEAEITRSAPSVHDTHGDIRQGFVYERVPHITLKSIANNTEIDEIWERMQPAVEAARARLNAALAGHAVPFTVETGGRKGEAIDFTASGEVTLPSGEPAPAGGFMEWEIPREAPDGWPDTALAALEAFWTARIARQKEIDASIAAKADFEYLYDKPYEDRKRVRVAGPFTVESLSPHKSAAVDGNGELIDDIRAAEGARLPGEQEAENYRKAIMENLAKAGVQQRDRGEAIRFDSLTPWPGDWIAAEGRYMEGETQRRAAIFIGPEYGTVQRADLVATAREAADAGFDIVIACAFNFAAHAGEFHKLGRIPILHARMNADLHMAGDLKAGGGNLFVVFGEPDIDLLEEGERLRVRINGVDIFRPSTGEVESTEAGDIACWFIDTDYSGESFFVRHAYFPGADIPYKQLKTTLKGEVDEEMWESLKRTTSRPFPRPKTGRIAVKVINHLGDEVMKVMGV